MKQVTRNKKEKINLLFYPQDRYLVQNINSYQPPILE